jgi:hypothetical protein
MSLSTRTPRLNPNVSRMLAHHAASRLLETIAGAFEGGDCYGATIEKNSVDTQGLSIRSGVFRFRLELIGEPELLDWNEHTPDSFADRDLTWMDDPSDDIPF